MILEFEDMTGKVSWGHLAVPPGLTMGQMLDQHPKLKEFSRFVECATVNGVPDPRWRNLDPSGGQRVRLYVKPGGPILGILSAISFLVSVVSFFISLFNQPKQRKAEKSSQTYAFEGIADVLSPGDPIPVVYGRHRKGGQVLMYYVDVNANKKGQTMSLLLGMCEGEIDAIESNSILLNGVAWEDVGSVTLDMRMGTSSQAIIPGFEQIKNTFFDGREVPPREVGVSVWSKSLIYRSVTPDTQLMALELQLLFPDGIWNLDTTGDDAGSTNDNFVTYEVAWTNASPEVHSDGAFWTIFPQRKVSATTRERYFDVFPIATGGVGPAFGSGHIYVRIQFVTAGDFKPGGAGFRFILQNVTEFGLASGPFSGIAQLAVRAAASEQLHGGRPNTTAIVRGRKVRQYTSLTSFTTAWTQNPSWNVLDYMTNSVYGMGPWVTYGDADIQSFIDFASLADSIAPCCD